MWTPCDDTAGLLLVEVLGEIAAHRGDRTLLVGPPEHHREVAHVGGVLLFEVQVQSLAGDLARREARPRPVPLAFHHLEQRFAERVAIHHTSVRRPRGTTTRACSTAMRQSDAARLVRTPSAAAGK